MANYGFSLIKSNELSAHPQVPLLSHVSFLGWFLLDMAEYCRREYHLITRQALDLYMFEFKMSLRQLHYFRVP